MHGSITKGMQQISKMHGKKRTENAFIYIAVDRPLSISTVNAIEKTNIINVIYTFAGTKLEYSIKYK